MPFKYSCTTRGSKFATVVSKWIPPARLSDETASEPTTVGNPPWNTSVSDDDAKGGGTLHDEHYLKCGHMQSGRWNRLD